jgi:hypothetical protein
MFSRAFEGVREVMPGRNAGLLICDCVRLRGK